MKKLLWLCIILIPIMLWAQESNTDEEQQSGFGMGGMVGSVTIGAHTYSQIRLMPEIVFWKFGFGLDIDLLIDAEGNVREEDWDEAQDIINKIYYIRFAQRGEPFYARVGGFPYYTLGHGLIMNDYSNMLLYPNERNIGAMVGFNLPVPLSPGMEVFTSNVQKNEILAANLHFKPVSSTGIPLLKNLTVGVSVGMDRDQYGKYEDNDGDKVPDIFDPFPDDETAYVDTDNDGVSDAADIDIDGDNNLDSPEFNPYVGELYPWIIPNSDLLDTLVVADYPRQYGDSDEAMVYSVDYDLPLITTKAFSLGHYAEYAQIKDYGSGFIFPGFYSKFLIFDANLEMRNFGDKFLPGFFDHLYDEQRSSIGPDTLLTKESTLEYVKACYGWYGSIKANLFNILFMKVAYQDMYGTDVKTGKSIWATLGADPKIIPKLKEASISYDQTNVPYLSVNQLQTPSASITGTVSYGISDNAYLVGKYTERYVDLNADNDIKGKDETIKAMTFGVEFKF